MQFEFTYDEMKNFILKTGKYKIVNVKCSSPAARGWYNGWQYTQEEVEIEVAYLIDDIDTEKWIKEQELREPYSKRKDDYYMFFVAGVFYKEFKNKLLNL